MYYLTGAQEVDAFMEVFNKVLEEEEKKGRLRLIGLPLVMNVIGELKLILFCYLFAVC